MSTVQRKNKRKKKSAVRKGAADLAERRIARLEKLVDLMLQASLRGRLLPNERRVIKRHLRQRNMEQREEKERKSEEEGPRCPACRLPIEDEQTERCPHCSVLLAVARGSARKR